MARKLEIVVDFGAQHTQLITRRTRESETEVEYDFGPPPPARLGGPEPIGRTRLAGQVARLWVALLLLFASVARAEEPCDRRDDSAMCRRVAAARGWSSLRTIYRSLAPCDDGLLAECISDRVVTLLSTKWAALPKLRHLVQRDSSFASAVLMHVDATADSTALAVVAGAATQKCPPGCEALCTRIAQRANEALFDIATTHKEK